MCGFCVAAGVPDPCEKGLGSIEFDLSPIAETTGNDIAGDFSTDEAMRIGDTFQGTLNGVNDQDWVRIDLVAGDSIQINMTGVDHAGSTLGATIDPFLRLFDSSGNLVAFDDDGGEGRNSQLIYVATGTGTFYIEADSWRSDTNPTYPGFAGDYEITVQAVDPPPPASPVDAIQGATALNTNDPVLVYFAEAGDQYSDGSNFYTASGVNAYEQGQLWSVFEGVEQFIDVDFQITTNRAAADLEWATATLPQVSGGTLLGFFFFPSFSGQGGFGILNNNSNAFPSWNSTPGGTLDTGGFMYGVAVHELGHGLGLGHTHDTGNGTDVMQGVTGVNSRGAFNLNMAAYTAMSYNEGSDVAGVASSTASTGHGATFSALDIAALQNMYGANTTHAGGNDVYTLIEGNATGSAAGYYTTWDTGGTDEFRYTGGSDAIIDLRAATLNYEFGGGGFVSYVDGTVGGRTIANGVVIENATSGSGDDLLIGNDAANTLIAGAGVDTVQGGAGDDLIIGGGGDDELVGGLGADTFAFEFGDGFDTIFDFEIGVDVIDFLGLGFSFDDLSISDVNGSARVDYDETTNGTLSFSGLSASQLTEESFLVDLGPVEEPADTGLLIGGVGFELESYASGQDFGSVTFSADGTSATLTDNAWKRAEIDQTITSNTVLRFDFRSDVLGEIHGIGLDTDNALTEEWIFQLDGSQTWGSQQVSGQYTTGSGWQSYEIAVGEVFTGTAENLVFVMDDDDGLGADSAFRNLEFVEGVGSTAPQLQIDGESYALQSYATRQDFGTAAISANGSSATLTNNSWKRAEIDREISADTVLRFDFRSDALGEIHGIGLDTDSSLTEDWIFQLDGLQTWGNQEFAGQYTTGSGWQTYEIAVGEFFTGAAENLVFVMDDDVGRGADSAFRDIEFL